MPSQKALHLEKAFKGPWVVRDRAIPKPGPGFVLIKVLSAALNPVDWKAKEFGWSAKEHPAVLGHDGAGTIEELGEGVRHWKKGDRV